MSEENVTTEWVESVPEFARNWDEVKQADGMEALFNRFGDQRSHLGSSIRLPGEDASADDKTAFEARLMEKVPGLMRTPEIDDQDSVNGLLKRLGKPDDAAGYSDIESDEVSYDEGQLAALKQTALDIGLTKRQFEVFAKKIGVDNLATKEAVSEANNGAVKAIQEKWGLSAEAKYQETFNFAKKAGAPAGLVQAMTDKTIDSETVFWLNSLAANLGESTNADFSANNSSGSTMTPGEAQEAIDEILGNLEHGYHQGQKAARDRMHMLMGLANPGRYDAA